MVQTGAFTANDVVELAELTTTDIEVLGDSALGHALRRITREQQCPREQPIAAHEDSI